MTTNHKAREVGAAKLLDGAAKEARTMVRETPAIEVSTAGRSEPAVLALRERALSLREAVGSVGATPEALARARELVARAVAVALGKG